MSRKLRSSTNTARATCCQRAARRFTEANACARARHACTQLSDRGPEGFRAMDEFGRHGAPSAEKSQRRSGLDRPDVVWRVIAAINRSAKESAREDDFFLEEGQHSASSRSLRWSSRSRASRLASMRCFAPLPRSLTRHQMPFVIRSAAASSPPPSAHRLQIRVSGPRAPVEAIEDRDVAQTTRLQATDKGATARIEATRAAYHARYFTPSTIIRADTSGNASKTDAFAILDMVTDAAQRCQRVRRRWLDRA